MDHIAHRTKVMNGRTHIALSDRRLDDQGQDQHRNKYAMQIRTTLHQVTCHYVRRQDIDSLMHTMDLQNISLNGIGERAVSGHGAAYYGLLFSTPASTQSYSWLRASRKGSSTIISNPKRYKEASLQDSRCCSFPPDTRTVWNVHTAPFWRLSGMASTMRRYKYTHATQLFKLQKDESWLWVPPPLISREPSILHTVKTLEVQISFGLDPESRGRSSESLSNYSIQFSLKTFASHSQLY
jgi:hypothetical protein